MYIYIFFHHQEVDYISPMSFVYRSGKTLMIYITSRNCEMSLFPESGKNEVIFCLYLYS